MFEFVPCNRGYSDDDLSKVQEKCFWVSFSFSFFLRKEVVLEFPQPSAKGLRVQIII